LVVEDYPALRMALRLLLEEQFQVTICTDGPESIEFVKMNSGSITAAVIDFILPTMNGDEVCASLREIDPTIRLIGLTGSDTAVFREPLFGLLRKKYTSHKDVISMLSAAVDESLRLKGLDPIAAKSPSSSGR